MTPELIAVTELFILRIGVPILLVLGVGYLASRYLQGRAITAKNAKKEQETPLATGQDMKEARRKAA